MSHLDELKKQYLELGKEIQRLEKEHSFVHVSVPAPDGCFNDFRVGLGPRVEFRLYPVTEGNFTHEEGLKYTRNEGHRLMTKEEIHLLLAAGIDLGNTSFWSSSVRADSHDVAWLFIGNVGFIFCANRSVDYAVRWVGPARF